MGNLRPCFLWIFFGAPYIEWLRGHKALTDALSAITSAVVGVILNLAVWFALYTLFGRVDIDIVETGLLRLHVPVLGTLDPSEAVIAVGAFVALFTLRWGMFKTLAAGALAGLFWTGCLRLFWGGCSKPERATAGVLGVDCLHSGVLLHGFHRGWVLEPVEFPAVARGV